MAEQLGLTSKEVGEPSEMFWKNRDDELSILANNTDVGWSELATAHWATSTALSHGVGKLHGGFRRFLKVVEPVELSKLDSLSSEGQ